jgi:hypothetical protein
LSKTDIAHIFRPGHIRALMGHTADGGYDAFLVKASGETEASLSTETV